MKNTEMLPVVNNLGKTIGKATREDCHNGSMLLHPVIHLHIFNSKGELFIQQRSKTKSIFPNLWDTSVAGHIDYGEQPMAAALREAKEELGIQNLTIYPITEYIINMESECEYNYCFYTIYDDDYFVLDPTEVSQGHFEELSKIWQNIGKGIFTPNFELDFTKFLYKTLNNLEHKI